MSEEMLNDAPMGSSNERGEKLRHLREDVLGWGVVEAANRTGIARSTINRLERIGRGSRYMELRDALEVAAGRRSPDGHSGTPSEAIETLVRIGGGTPSLMIRELQSLIEKLPTDQERWAAVATFARMMLVLNDERRNGVHEEPTTKP